MKMMKVYDADGKHVESFKLPDKVILLGGSHPNKNTMIRHLNKNGYYIHGQTTSKGVRIK